MTDMLQREIQRQQQNLHKSHGGSTQPAAQVTELSYVRMYCASWCDCVGWQISKHAGTVKVAISRLIQTNNDIFQVSDSSRSQHEQKPRPPTKERDGIFSLELQKPPSTKPGGPEQKRLSGEKPGECKLFCSTLMPNNSPCKCFFLQWRGGAFFGVLTLLKRVFICHNSNTIFYGMFQSKCKESCPAPKEYLPQWKIGTDWKVFVIQ